MTPNPPIPPTIKPKKGIENFINLFEYLSPFEVKLIYGKLCKKSQ